MKKIKLLSIVLVLPIILLISCKGNSLDCNGISEKETVKSIMKKSLLKSTKHTGINETYLDSLFKKNINFNLIRITDKNEELKSCGCSATLSFNYSNEMINFIKNIDRKKYTIINWFGEFRYIDHRDLLNDDIIINYNIQKTLEGETMIEVPEISEELVLSIIKYHLSEKYYFRNKSNPLPKDKDDLSIEKVHRF